MKLGHIDGCSVGFFEGRTLDGLMVGKFVGGLLGRNDGRIGCFDGITDGGIYDGVAEGSDDGSRVGPRVGIEEGVEEGSYDSCCVELIKGSIVGNSDGIALTGKYFKQISRTIK